MLDEDIKKCDEQAKELLNLTDCELSMRKVLDNFHAVYYKKSIDDDGHAVIVCQDGSVLLAEPCVPFSYHVLAFSEGLRSDPDLISV